MENLFSFLRNASIGFVLLYTIYFLFLRKETFYKINRWFLLGSLLVSVLLAIFPVQYQVVATQQSGTTIFQVMSDTFKNAKAFNPSSSNAETEISWQQILFIIYLTGTAIFLFRLLIQTIILIHLIIKNRIKDFNGLHIVENKKYGLPFSFFNLIFINPKFHTQKDLPEILAHEKVHIRGFHWVDLLFTELLTVIFWFNPFIWFFEHSIKQNHEYLADEGVLAQGHSAGRYQAILLNQLMGMQIIGLTNNLNFALNTNRLKMMTKKKTSAIRRIKIMWALPVIAIMLYAFAEPDCTTKNIQSANAVSTLQKSEKEFTIHGKVVRENNGEPMHGASIIIKGTTHGAIADKDGIFTVTDPNPLINKETGELSSTIVISFVGMQTIEKIICNKTGTNTFSFKMKEGVINISPVLSNDLPPVPEIKKEKHNPAPSTSSASKKDKKERQVFFVVEEMPQYPEGINGLKKDILTLKEKISSEGVKGKTLTGFTVNEKGEIANIKILKKDNKKAAKKAAIIISKLKNWTPGKQRGIAVPVNYTIPIEF